MLGNFLYYIIALLIYATYQAPAGPGPSLANTLVLFFLLALFFAGFTRRQFQKIKTMAAYAPARDLDSLFHATLTRHSILALFVYALDIYALQLDHFLSPLPLLNRLPTLEALLFLCLFIFYMALVWAFAYSAFLKIYQARISRRDYVLSNIAFSIPVILPWLILSLTADLINILPFDAPRRFLSSTEGQILYFIFFLVLIAIIGPLLILKFWGCRPLPPGPFRRRIELICWKAKMHYRDIMVWPLFGGRMITAGVMGLVRRFRYILITPALMRHLSAHEVDAVIAHEIGHIKKNHLFFYLVFFAGYLVVAMTLMDLFIYGIFYADAVLGVVNTRDPAWAPVSSIGFSLAMIGIFLIYFRYIFGYFMRNFERQADLFAFGMFQDAGPLISTFEKITITSGQSPTRPNWHHFSIQERIDTLKACEKNPSLVARHSTKVNTAIGIYLIMILMVGWMGYQLHYQDMGTALTENLLQKAIVAQMEKNPDDPDLHQILGDIYLNQKNYEKAIAAYQQAIRLDESHVPALNNLAWLLATCDKKAFVRPEKALDLAKQAAALSPEPHVLDTLAEALYVNGDYAGALAAGKQALSRAETDLAYYRQQVAKFRAALSR